MLKSLRMLPLLLAVPVPTFSLKSSESSTEFSNAGLVVCNTCGVAFTMRQVRGTAFYTVFHQPHNLLPCKNEGKEFQIDLGVKHG